MENINPLVSVIVPVYNTERYLEQCIDSLLNQTYKKIEIIIINDGSNTICTNICDKYLKIDSRIKVIHKKNEGVSSARNIGLDIALGDYISFVDSDDYAHKDMIEESIRAIINSNSDIVHFNFENINEQGIVIKSKNKDLDDYKILNSYGVLYNYIAKYKIKVMPWNKLYKKSIFDNIRFDEGYVYEDELIFPKLIHKSNKNIMLNKKLYFYRYNSNGITKSEFNKIKLESKKRTIEFLEKFYLEKYPELVYYVYISNCFNCLGTLKGIKKFGLDKKEYVFFIKKYLEYYKKLKKSKINFPILIKKRIYLLTYNILLSYKEHKFK